LAGLILNRKKARSIAIIIHIIAVVRYVHIKKAMIPNTIKIITIVHQASPSSPSVIFIAFTITTVKINVKIGYNNHRLTSQVIGRKLME